mmetsp:Transcript_37810/g.92015  ORF Transcript_37810/g.92015 Transcript_37810/m.92015 type:complete len:123 (+) Transcript_37810:234-602(+)
MFAIWIGWNDVPVVTGVPRPMCCNLQLHRQPHELLVLSANSCAATHSDCVNCESSPITAMSKHCIPAMNPLMVGSWSLRQSLQKTVSSVSVGMGDGTTAAGELTGDGEGSPGHPHVLSAASA